MKANLFAAVLSLCVISVPVQATNPNPPLSPQTSALSGASEKIDLNTSDAMILAKSFKGIGQKRAEAIVNYRKEQGKFNSVEELAKVKGIGDRFVKAHLTQLQEIFRVS